MATANRSPQTANRSRPGPRAYSGDWTFGVRDWTANWAPGDPFRAVSNLRARKGPRNAGLCAGHGEVAEFRECVADDAVSPELVSGSEFPANREKNRDFGVFW